MLNAARTLAAVLLLGTALAAQAALPQRAAVASAHPLATAAGLEVLAAGGNAFDAAVAVSAALAVVEPYSSGLGGGGFWLLHRAADGHEVVVDGREEAPRAAHPRMYLDAEGRFDRRRSLDGPLAAAIPGEPAALDHIAREYGRVGLARALAPAIRLAREGFAVTPRYQRLAAFRRQALNASPEAASLFLIDGEVPPLGHVIRQPELAALLEAMAREGARAFYHGPFARRLVAGVRAAGGIWTEEDLAAYRVREREPLRQRYGPVRLVTVPPPSSGGTVLIEALNILEHFPWRRMDPDLRRHVVIEAMRRAYRDRAVFLGDPEFAEVPLRWLLDRARAAELAAGISLERATPSAELGLAPARDAAGTHTTHLSVVDREGNRVAATLSINYPFGAAFVPPGTGVLLNDEMDDFAPPDLAPNAYGLVGTEANAVAPGKRPLSSMTPTFIEEGERVAILGTPGGSRIISMVLLAALDFMRGNGPSSWVRVPRYHHQFLPDEVQFERGGLTARQQAALRALGHRLRELRRRYGNMQAVQWCRRDGLVMAASDPRGEGRADYWPRPGGPIRGRPGCPVSVGSVGSGTWSAGR